MPKIVDEEGHALKAILLLVLGMSFIPLNDALIKVMSERLPLAEIVAMRAVMSLGILIIFTKAYVRFRRSDGTVRLNRLA
jgi:hypothetical protein